MSYDDAIGDAFITEQGDAVLRGAYWFRFAGKWHCTACSRPIHVDETDCDYGCFDGDDDATQ